MNVNLKNAGNDSLVHLVVRMTSDEYKALRTYMHTKDGEFIWFPYGSFLAPRGRGWYRVVAHQDKRGCDKVDEALKIIQRFMRDEEKKVEEQIKVLAPVMIDPTLRPCAFSTSQSKGDWSYIGDPGIKAPNSVPTPPQVLPPASPQRLQALAAKFARPQSSK